MSNRRVHYREHQRVRAADLQAEQNERTNARRRHQIGQHTWGIVYGLALAYEDDLLQVQPGSAVDGYGRELLVSQPLVAPHADLVTAFDEAGLTKSGDSVDVWLVLLPVLNASGTRWADTVALHLAPAGQYPPRQPFDVPSDDAEFEAWRALPDETFPVALGRMIRRDHRFDIDSSCRVYAAFAGLVGEEVVTPSREASLHLEDPPQGRVTLEMFGQDVFQLAHTDETNKTQMTIHGDVRLDIQPTAIQTVGGLPETGTPRHRIQGVSYPAGLPQPEAALPWSVYRNSVPVLGPDGSPTDDPPLDQLRLEMLDPAQDGDPALQRLTIGVRNGTEFQPCLQVRANCEVEVYGDVQIEGEGVERPIPADPFDLRFQEALLNQWQTGMVAGDDRIVPTPVLDIRITPDPANTFIEGVPVRYRVQIENTSRFPVSMVRVNHQYIDTDANKTPHGPTLLATLPRLEGQSQSSALGPVEIIPTRSGQLPITVTVTAFAADLAVVTQKTTLTLTINVIQIN